MVESSQNQDGNNGYESYKEELENSTHKSIIDKLSYLRENSNFQSNSYKIRDDCMVNVFVNHFKYNQKGQSVDAQSPQKKQQKEEVQDSSDEDDDEEQSENGNDEEEVEITNQYMVDMIAEYKDQNDDLILHWGIGKKVPGEWTGADDKYLPKDTETKRWPDGKACQTKFKRENTNPNFRMIHLDFKWKQDVEPAVKSVSYVFMEQKRNQWYNNGGQDWHIKFQIEPEHHTHNNKNLPIGKIGDVVNEIIECETVYVNFLKLLIIIKQSSWTLMHRYGRCKDILQQRIDQSSRDHVAYLFIWLRYSFTKHLTWQKNYNTKPRDLQGAQVSLIDEICGQYVRQMGKEKETFLTSGDLLRSMMSMIGKGSGNGQRVRDEILHIMHRHKIPETQGHFYEQWHQKLHNNTTPDDIYICEALLAYLKSGGNMSKYWEVLNNNGVTKERLASYERKITCEPWMKPEAIHDFEEYLVILKQMHSSGDLELLSNEAKQHLGNDTKGMIDDVLRNFGDSDTLRQMERVSKLRYNLNQYHMDRNNQRKLKDIVFLDLGLETYLRGLTERIIHIDIGFEAYVREAAIILSNLSLSYQWNELNVCKEDWDKIVQPFSKDMNEDNARKIKSVVDRIKQSLGEVNDQFMNVIQSKAELLGKEFGVPEYAYKIFAEELIRGTLFFSLSMILKKIDPLIRKCAHLGDWLVISQGRSHGSRGYAEKVKNLYDVMHKTYDKRTILFCEKINGEEEVPNNVQAIVLLGGTDYPDVLAHVSVRARNLKVMFVVCFDENKISELEKLLGKHCFFISENHNIRFQEQNPDVPITRRASSSLILQSIIDNAKKVKAPPEFPKSFMQIDEFNSQNMGAKSNNLKILKDGIPSWIFLPESGCIPFRMMEYTLDMHEQIRDELNSLIEHLNTIKSVKKMNRYLYKCKDLVMKLQFDSKDQNHAYLKQSLLDFGISAKDFEQAWKTIKMVWASKFNERAFLATKKIGVTLHSVYMAVLVQRIIPSEYAYVVHTFNPTNGEESEVYVEACLGLGEALVSKMPGQAFSFTYNKVTQQSNVNAYPNKPIGLKAEGFIFRSDSNSEDLPGFAGAGLFDSYPMHDTSEFRITYNKERLITDKQFRQNFMNNIGQIGVEIEKLYGEAQDIEGAYFNNKFHVVQTRPQV